MQFTQRADFSPGICAVTGKGTSEAPDGFIDTCNEIGGFHVYVSLAGLARMCEFVEWPTKEQYEELVKERERWEAEREEREIELAELRAFKASVHVIEGQGFKPRKKPGRPKKETPVAV
jgi:hypothetical protein